MPRRWSRAAQAQLEKPAEPLTAHCQRHRPRRTTIRLRGTLIWWCLACCGCPRCGAHQVWETIDDSDLLHDPIKLEGRPVRGDWTCLTCGESLVDWSSYRRAVINWRRGLRALREGYRRPEERAA